jgi:hypothetical protein
MRIVTIFIITLSITFTFLATQATAAVTFKTLGIQEDGNIRVSYKEAPVQFTTEPAAGKDLRVVLFIQDPNGNWWPYLNAGSKDRISWSIPEVQFGNENEANATFYVQVLVLPDNITTEGLTLKGKSDPVFISGGNQINPGTMRLITKTVSGSDKSKIVKVIRR